MSQKNAYHAYSLATRTVAKTRQVVLLYDGAIRFLRQAKEAMAEKRIEARFNLLRKVSDILVGLQSSIDFDQGGEVAHTLHRFYTGMTMRVLTLNQSKQLEDFDQVIASMKEMRDTWDAIDKNNNGAPAPLTAPAAELPSALSNVTLSA